MRRNRSYSIYRHIIVVILVPFLTLTFLLLLLYEIYYASMLSQAETGFDLQEEQYRLYLEGQLDEIRQAAQTAGYSESVQKYFVRMNERDRVNNYTSIRELFDTLIRLTDGVSALCIMDDNGGFLNSEDGYLHYFQRANEAYDTGNRALASAFFTDLIGESDAQAPKYCIYYSPIGIITPISMAEDVHSLTCAMLFDVTQLLNGRMPGGVLSQELLIWDGQVVASDGTLAGAGRELFDAIAADEGLDQRVRIDVGGVSYFYRRTALSSENGMVYAFVMPVDFFMDEAGNIKTFLLVGIAGCMAMVVVLMLLLRRGISRPIEQIAHDMSQIDARQIVIRSTNVVELQILANGVNDMLSKLMETQRQEMRNRERIQQLEFYRVQAEMLAYRSQINPHFLFNTMGCIVGMAVHYGIEPLEALGTALCDSLNYALRAPDTVELRQEIEHVGNYMRILDVRMPGKYQLILRVQPEALERRVLSLMLQPLLENAVLHGFEDFDKRAKCALWLSARIEEGGTLHLCVVDNGNGIEEARLADILRQMRNSAFPMGKQRIALKNIWRRMRIAYGDGCAMDICSRRGHYTRIDIQIPPLERDLRHASGDAP